MNDTIAHALDCDVSTHSRPKAAARYIAVNGSLLISFNSQPPEGGCSVSSCVYRAVAFQLTAARRRLRYSTARDHPYMSVSTHSRPKAAANVVRGGW